jgi:hypothetical protein
VIFSLPSPFVARIACIREPLLPRITVVYLLIGRTEFFFTDRLRKTFRFYHCVCNVYRSSPHFIVYCVTKYSQRVEKTNSQNMLQAGWSVLDSPQTCGVPRYSSAMQVTDRSGTHLLGYVLRTSDHRARAFPPNPLERTNTCM